MYRNKEKICVILLIILAMLLLMIMFLCTPKADKSKDDGRILVSETRPEAQFDVKMDSVNYAYMIKKKGDYYAIYKISNTDGKYSEEFFDYTKLNVETMEREIRESLDKGRYFNDEYDLYAFLQAYTS